jgi:transposase
MTLPFASSSLSSAEKDALIATLLARIDELSKRLDALEKENAELRAKLKLPPKTPDNSSTPPARGQKSSEEAPPRPKSKAHPGAHRPLHPNPTRKRDVLAAQCRHCGTDVSGVTQGPVHTYDRIKIRRK